MGIGVDGLTSNIQPILHQGRTPKQASTRLRHGESRWRWRGCRARRRRLSAQHGQRCCGSTD
eukprot:589625-Amphidinium_carterae.1